VVGAAMTIDAFATPEQRHALLPRVADGSLVLACAFGEFGDDLGTSLPATTATRDGAGWRLDGEKPLVSMAHVADRLLVSARTRPGACGVFLINARDAGVTLETTETTARERRSTVRVNDVRVGAEDVIGAPDAGMDIVAATTKRLLAGLCAMQAGVSAEALRLTAAHVSEREQFGQKIATFQAVAQRAADAYIDTEAITLTARQAAWLLANGGPADAALHTAKFWAAEAGFRVAHAAQHLHGGIGVDTEYPLFRYFRMTRQIELTLGGAAVHLKDLGDRIAGPTGA